jgi:hypothetical protein
MLINGAGFIRFKRMDLKNTNCIGHAPEKWTPLTFLKYSGGILLVSHAAGIILKNLE